MAFDARNFDIGPMAAKGVPKMMRYTSTGEAIATIVGATYFDSSIVSELATVGDCIYVVGSDGAGFRRVSAKASNADITLAALS